MSESRKGNNKNSNKPSRSKLPPSAKKRGKGRRRKPRKPIPKKEVLKNKNKKPKEGDKSTHRSRSRFSRSHSKSRSRSSSRSRSVGFITDEDILHTEIKGSLKEDDFQEIEKLGGGDLSQINLAVYIPLSKYVALKVLDKHGYLKRDQVPFSYREKQMLREIESPFKIKYLGIIQKRRLSFFSDRIRRGS